MDAPRTCPLCDAIEVHDERTRHVFKCREVDGFVWFDIACDRCGDYRVQQEWLADATHDGTRVLPRNTALQLSFLARQPGGSKRLVVTADNFEDLMRGAPPPLSGVQYFERVVDLLASMSSFPGVPTKPAPVRAYAAYVRMPTAAFLGIANLLYEEKVLRWKDGNEPSTSFELLPEGWRRAELARRRGPLGSKAFVAMWFSEEVRDAYEQGIKPALVAAGYEEPFRVDDPEHDRAHGDPEHRPRIDDRIIAELRRSRFVVADSTGARPSVYFEAGYAEALGLPVIWCCRRDRQEEMAFDTRQLAHILWTDPADLRRQLSDRLARLGLVRT